MHCVLVSYFGAGDYKLLEHASGRIFRSHDVVFEEGAMHCTLPDDRTGMAADLFDVFDVPSLDSSNTPEVLPFLESPTHSLPSPAVTAPAPVAAPHRSARLAEKKDKAMSPLPNEDPIALDDTDPESKEETFAAMPGALSLRTADADELWIPKSYSEAMCRPDLWCEPMDQEMAKMHERKVWRLVKRPEGARTMKNCWVFALKYGVDGQVVGRKARLVAKGFSQIPGVNYFATYALVVKFESLCMNLAVGAVEDYEIWQVDYTSTYLNAPTQVPILMEQLEGYEVRASNVYCVNVNEGKRVQGAWQQKIAWRETRGDWCPCLTKPCTGQWMMQGTGGRCWMMR